MRVLAVALTPEYVATKVRFTPPAAVAAASGVQLKFPAVKVAPAGPPVGVRAGAPDGCDALTENAMATPAVPATRAGAAMLGGRTTGEMASMCVAATEVNAPSEATKSRSVPPGAGAVKE